MRKRYTVTGQFFGHQKGDVITLDSEKVEAQGLLTKLRELPGDVEASVEAAPEKTAEAPKAPDPASTPAPTSPAPAPAAKAETKTAAPKVPGGPPMPGAKAVVTPEAGK